MTQNMVYQVPFLYLVIYSIVGRMKTYRKLKTETYVNNFKRRDISECKKVVFILRNEKVVNKTRKTEKNREKQRKTEKIKYFRLVLNVTLSMRRPKD